MKTVLEKVSTLERRLNVEIPASLVGESFEKLGREAQKKSQIKGFRPGKAPMSTVQLVYKDEIINGVVEDLIRRYYPKALEEHSLDPIGHPEFDFENKPIVGEEFLFTARFEIQPEVVLKKTEGLEVEKEKFQVDEAQVELVLNNIRLKSGGFVNLLEDRPAQQDDFVIIDFTVQVDGQLVSGESEKDFLLQLGSKTFIEGFEDGIIGMSVGSTKTLHLQFPDGYKPAELSGKSVIFEVTLKSLKRRELFELDDQFPQRIGSAEETLEQYKNKLRQEIESVERNRIERDFKEELLKVLVKENPVDIPPSFLREQEEILIKNMRRKAEESGRLQSENIDNYIKQVGAEITETARYMLSSNFLIHAVANKHNIKITDEDVEARLASLSKSYNLTKEKIEEVYLQSKNMQQLGYSVLEEKVIDFLSRSAKVKEMEKSPVS